MNAFGLSLEIPDDLSIISDASTAAPVPSYQMTDATIRDIQFEEISNEDLLFWVQYLKALLRVFAVLPLRRNLDRFSNQVHYSIDWAQLGPEFRGFVRPTNQVHESTYDEEICPQIQEWFAQQVPSGADPQATGDTQATMQRFEDLHEQMQSSLTQSLRADLRMTPALREFQRNILSLIDRKELLDIALCEPFTVTQSPLAGEPNVFNVISDVENILRS